MFHNCDSTFLIRIEIGLKRGNSVLPCVRVETARLDARMTRVEKKLKESVDLKVLVYEIYSPYCIQNLDISLVLGLPNPFEFMQHNRVYIFCTNTRNKSFYNKIWSCTKHTILAQLFTILMHRKKNYHLVLSPARATLNYRKPKERRRVLAFILLSDCSRQTTL